MQSNGINFDCGGGGNIFKSQGAAGSGITSNEGCDKCQDSIYRKSKGTSAMPRKKRVDQSGAGCDS
ncbi:unnamed protein product [Prunus armeniaca]|uniref:Uncharacterized protein n=1 Tax=Prunus armeniaca TaxID=36596 RepID=A0A6J5WE26_PRUAR|nr:unnamed protein product [Prunus armeniaca]